LYYFRDLQHPNILLLFEVYENDQYIHAIFEEAKEGTLSTLIKTKGKLPENFACLKIMKNLLSAICLLHEKHIMHRNINPDNLAFSYKIIFIDFLLK